MSEVARRLEEEANRVLPRVIELRRHFHAHPELAFQEVGSSEKVAAVLTELGIEVRRKIATTGLVGVLRGGGEGPAIGLRADMDALPIEEQSGVPFSSKTPGVMHACGHDGHMAMLLGAAMVLAPMRKELKGNIVFIFQPGEEGYAGASRMIDEGVLDAEPRIKAVFALHLDSLSPSGRLSVKDGPIMACADVFTLSIIGRGGHGAMPHTSIDPVLVSGHVITALQAIAGRQVDPTEPVVVSVCSIHGGTAVNVIPDKVDMSGTVRLFDPGLRERMPALMEDIIKGVTSAFGARYEFNYFRGYPATINDPGFTRLVRSVAVSVLGREQVAELERPRMPSEDFSFFLEKVPGTFALLGARQPHGRPTPSHSPNYAIDESALGAGVKLHAAIALGYLGETL